MLAPLYQAHWNAFCRRPVQKHCWFLCVECKQTLNAFFLMCYLTLLCLLPMSPAQLFLPLLLMQPLWQGHGWRLNKHVDPKYAQPNWNHCLLLIQAAFMYYVLGCFAFAFCALTRTGLSVWGGYPDLYEWTIKNMFELRCLSCLCDVKLQLFED